jgi:hypothetical protein
MIDSVILGVLGIVVLVLLRQIICKGGGNMIRIPHVSTVF